MADDAGTRWVDLVAVEELKINEGRRVTVGNLDVAVFKVEGGEGGMVRVIDDTCPHAGASLANGYVEGKCVICPWHAWCFELENGRMPGTPEIAVASFAVKVEGGRVWADLAKPQRFLPVDDRKMPPGP